MIYLGAAFKSSKPASKIDSLAPNSNGNPEPKIKPQSIGIPINANVIRSTKSLRENSSMISEQSPRVYFNQTPSKPIMKDSVEFRKKTTISRNGLLSSITKKESNWIIS